MAGYLETEPAAEVRRLSDRAAIAELIDRYLLVLDDGAFDDIAAHAVFTDDVALEFPPGNHYGVAGVARFTRGFMGHWARTHHHASNYLIDLDGDRAAVTWNVLATHVHPDSPPPPASGNHFQLGGRFEGVAVRQGSKWRLQRLALRVIWTSGVGVPSIARTMAGRAQ
jgi:SnoaL-like protein